MASYNQVKYGSSGDDVLELQKQLNANGYSLKEDGIFGSATQSAVRDYQTKNNLTVDGIVGDQTWGSLYSAGTTQSEIELPTYDHTQSDSVTQAQTLYEQYLTQKPDEYQSQYQTQINDKLQEYLNREDFQYDINEDALYQQYADRYIQQGKLAMMDTMGQAAALTGGYGNTYAQQAGQQAYQGYLQELNDIVPELQQQAWEQYQAEGDKLLNEYSLLSTQEQQDYSRYQDQLSSYLTERDYLASRYDSERDYDYSQYVDDRDFRYSQQQTEQDKLISLITTTGYQPTDTELTAAGMTRAQAKAYLSYYQDSGTSSSGGSSTPYSSDSGYDAETISAVQAFIGLPTSSRDGVWGTQSAAKAKEMGYGSLKAAVEAMNNYNEVLQYYITFKDGGASQKELDAYLEEEIAEGRITKDQAWLNIREYRW